WGINTSGPGRVESDSPMKTKTHFAFRIDAWDADGNSVVEHLAGLDDQGMAVAAYWAAVTAKPKEKITLRQGPRVMMKNWTGGGFSRCVLPLRLSAGLSAARQCGRLLRGRSDERRSNEKTRP